jgi:autotransporter strand-loop-strand O-heptosyltransferase
MSKTLINMGYPLGDAIAAMPYVNKYTIESGDEVLTLLGNSYHQNLFARSFPNIKYVNEIPSGIDRIINLMHSWTKPIQQNFAEQLGYSDPVYIHPKVDSFKKDRPIKGKYAVIGVHSTSQLKYWNHPGGTKVMQEAPNWNALCDMLRKAGITPVVTEKDELYGNPPYYNGIPKKSVKRLGLSLLDTINYIEHAEFFVGLSSGLAWLAHGLGQRVAMISNFSEDWYEFDLADDTYVRIINRAVCHGCWNRVGVDFDFVSKDWFWCPVYKGTPRQFECHTSITPEKVMESIKKWL